MTRWSEITIVPDPAIEGRLVRISLPGPGPWFISLDPTGELQPLPEDGRSAEVVAPGEGGQTFTVVSFGPPPVAESFDIVSPNP